MKVIKIAPRGYCYGVVDAMVIARNAAKNKDLPRPIYILGMIVHNKHTEPWKVTVVDTGLNTQTGGRVKRIREYIGNESFMLTYGDAVGNVNIKELVEFHKAHGKIGTMSMYNFGQNKGVVEYVLIIYQGTL